MKPEDLLLAPELNSSAIAAFLKKYGFRDPAIADRNLQLLADEPAIRNLLARIMRTLLEALRGCPDPDSALNYFERVCANVIHRANFLSYLEDSPESLEKLVLICGSSPFSAEILVRNPEYFYWLLDELGPSTKPANIYAQEALKAISQLSNSDGRLRSLARYKRRELLRISARDILRIGNAKASMAELSHLADAVLQAMYEICYHDLSNRYGVPVVQDSPCSARFTVIALGKLGGGELNYSSDIDLIFIFDGEGGHTQQSASTEEGISNRDYFSRLAKSITHELSRLTEEGYFYRVDLRLRPEGSTGPIASSLADCKNYYFSWGETFERMALIKARPVAGSLELGEEFCNIVEPFIYRRFLDFAALDEIQEIKTRIEAGLKGRERDNHIKLGSGGIRELEFFIQALQLIYGGRVKELRQPSSLTALEMLRQEGYLTRDEFVGLKEAYLFLRDLEHKLQMVYHFQTHELPSNQDELLRCARRMGFKGEDVTAIMESFLGCLERHRAFVQRSFEELVSFRHRSASASHAKEAALILNRNLDQSEALGIISSVAFRDPRTALHQIELLRDAPSFAHSPSTMRNLLANLVPSLLRELECCSEPDAVISSFERFASVYGARDALYILLNESPSALRRLIRILDSGPFLRNSLCLKPEFLDSLLRDEYLHEARSCETLLSKIREVLSAEASLEAKIRKLRQLHHDELFLIQIRDVLQVCNRRDIGLQLSELAEACLAIALELACQTLEEEYDPAAKSWAQEHFAIMALGKFGGADLSYNSDLDLVYFYSLSKTDEGEVTEIWASRIAAAIDEVLSVSRGEGILYRIDTRLRPEGRKGNLAAAIPKFSEYLETRAQTWERVAMVRYRFIVGSQRDRDDIISLLTAFIYSNSLTQSAIQEVIHVRRRLELEIGRELSGAHYHVKVGRGGLVDIEFAVQILQIQHGQRIPALRVSGTRVALARLFEHKLIGPEEFQILNRGYEFLRLLENRLRMYAEDPPNILRRTPTELTRVAQMMRHSEVDAGSGVQLERTYTDMTQQIRSITDHIFTTLLAAND